MFLKNIRLNSKNNILKKAHYMKSIFIALLSVSFGIISMEPMLVDQAKKEKSDDQEYKLLGKEFCQKIATIKQSEADITAYKEGELIPYNHDSHPESLFESATWCTTNMSHSNSVPLLEHQLWVSKYVQLPLVRFDNDTTRDCNEFGNPFSNGKDLFCYDGPNNDVSPGQEGRHNGVILVGHSYTSSSGKPQTVFHLFKQHGMHVRDYKGIQARIKTNGGSHEAFEYDQFPFTSERLDGHTITLSALAGGKRGAIATFDAQGQHHLHVFDYTYKENSTDKHEPDQSFETRIIAVGQNVPPFKRLAWLYGKTLVGISKNNELYIVAVNLPQNGLAQGTVSCVKQKTQKKFKDVALGRPFNHHEMILVDDKDQLYYSNLKERISLNAAFLLKKITEKADAKNNCSKVARSADAQKTSEPWIDKVWIYGEKIGIMRAHKAYRLDYSQPGWRWPVEKNMQFLSLAQAGWNAGIVNKNLCELYSKGMAKKEKPVSTGKNKKRNRKK